MASTSANLGRVPRFAIIGCSNAVIGYLRFMALYHSQIFSIGLRTPVAQLARYAAGVSWAFIFSGSEVRHPVMESTCVG